MTLSTRRARSPDQTAQATSGCIGLAFAGPIENLGAGVWFFGRKGHKNTALEHLHLLLGEPERGNPSQVMQAIKQGFARRFLGRLRACDDLRQGTLWQAVLDKDTSGRPASMTLWCSRRKSA